MINFASLDLSYIKDLISYVITNWYVILPVAVFFYLLPNIVEPLTIFGLGFLLGAVYVQPLVFNLVGKFYPQIVTSFSQNSTLIIIIFAILFGIILYGLYKSLIFIGSMALAFVGVLFIFNTFAGPEFGWYIRIAVGLIIGIIAGSFSVKNSAKFVGFVAVAVSSFVISVVSLAFIKSYLFKFNDFIFLWAILILSLIIFFLRINLLWRKDK